MGAARGLGSGCSKRGPVVGATRGLAVDAVRGPSSGCSKRAW